MSKKEEDNGAGCALMLGLVFLSIGLGQLYGFTGVMISIGAFFIILGLAACM